MRPPDSQLFIIACRDEQNALVGLAPFYLRQRRTAGIPHLRELLFLGTGVYAQNRQYTDIVARRGYEGLVVETVFDCLESRDDWDSLCLREIPAASVTLTHLSDALGQRAHV